MTTPQPTTAALVDQRIPVRAKVAARWTSYMFLVACVDILNGRVYEFDLFQTFSTTALALMAIPILMVALSLSLPARASRAASLVVASLYVPVTAFNVVGESWPHFYGPGVGLELLSLALVVRYAWTWPRTVTGRAAIEQSGPGTAR